MKRLITILCLLIPSLGVKAGTLKGKVIDQDAQPVAGAVITYYSCLDNSILASTTCDVNGNWELSYEEVWNNIHIVARAEGYTSYTLHGFNVSMNHTWPKIIFRLFNAIDYKAGKRSTIYLPEAPDVSWGRFYRLDHEDGNKVVFEREDTPKAYVPYVFFPYQDLHIDISKMDLSDHHDQVQLERISFSSAINYIVKEQPGSLVTQSVDEIRPYAEYSEEGAIEDYLSPAPMHAILSWRWYDFFEGNEEDGTWQEVSPEFIFHDPEPTTYHPFVERGKHWCVHGFSMGSHHTVTDYYFSVDKILFERNGHSYEQLRARTEDGKDELVGWFYEENQRVYMYNEEEDKDVLTYDFSLNVGDRFEPEYGDFECCEVTKIDYIVVNGDSLKVINFEANDKTSYLTVRVNGRWIEGIGSEMNPLDGLFSHRDPNSWSYHLAYVSGSSYWPFTFSIPYNGWWGTQLKTYGIRSYLDTPEILTYELVYDPITDICNLQVSGWQEVQCGPNNYIYCVAEPTESAEVYRLTFPIEEIEPMADCRAVANVCYSFSCFDKGKTYIVSDEQGVQVVPVRELAPYRPFIEDGKVWRVERFPEAINTSAEWNYFFFEGDTTVNNRLCKKMMCRHEAAEGAENTPTWTEYIGAFYEEDCCVYCAFPDSKTHELLYDFSSSVGTTLTIHGGSCIITRKSVSQEPSFKGNYMAIALYQQILNELTLEMEYGYNFYYYYLDYWYEGVGSFHAPLVNCREWVMQYGDYYELASCTVGDEVLYYNPYLMDGVTPPDEAQVKKHWIDFTHTTKPRPKAPSRVGDAGESEENLTGEYSVKQLFVNLKILSGTYTVTLRDAADNEVYRKQVQTNSTIALNTDLTKYPAGTYTLVVENSEEQYTATLTLPLDDTAVRDIPSNQIVNSKSLNSKCFDLSGRQLSTPPAKGIYIREGKKMMVK